MYSLIIVDYNSIKNTIEYVLSCKESLGTLGASHIVILENGAFDGTLDELCSYFGNYETCEISEIEQKIYKFSNGFQEILYCFSGDNLGYAKGNNLAISIAASVWNDPYYIVSNNDLVFKDQIDLTLVDKIFKEDDSVGVIGPSIITPNGETQSPRRWQSATHRLILNYWILSLSGIFSERLRNKLFNSFANDTIIEAKSGVCAWVSGCFMFIRAEAFQKCNMFDENTFLYAEEMILANRME